jgi:GT2 family glycosyltransferase
LRKQPLISVITVNFNGLDLTIELLNSIRQLSYKNIETFVVDNASNDNPYLFLNKNYPEVKFIRSEKNLGFAGGNNLAVKEAQGDFLFFVNNDAEITEGCIEKLLNLFEHYPNLGAVSPLLCYFNENPESQPDLIQYAGTTPVHPITARNRTIGEKEINKGQFNQPLPTAYTHGAAMMVKREIVENVGLMANDFFLYYEELDWCARIQKAGYEIMVEPRAKVYHKESVTVGAMSPLKTYYLNRNRIYFMRRNFSTINMFFFSLFLIFFTIPKNCIVFILRGQFNHLKVFLKAIWWNVVHDKNTKSEVVNTFQNKSIGAA